MIYKPIINDTTKRSILRWIHIVFSIPIVGYVYSRFQELPNYAPLFGLSPFLFLSLAPSTTCFENQPNKILQITEYKTPQTS
jgi:hypothetical protein